jgi:hypothetical protein
VSLVVAGVVGICCLTTAGVRGFWGLRQVVTGLDHIAVSLLLLALAVLISLGKAGALTRWVEAWLGKGALDGLWEAPVNDETQDASAPVSAEGVCPAPAGPAPEERMTP